MTSDEAMVLVYGAGISGVVSLIVHSLISKGKDSDKRIADLEKRMNDVEVKQRDIIYIKETQDRLVDDVRDMLDTLTDIRLKLQELIVKNKGE